MQDDMPSGHEEEPALERRLATIMMADVAGYSRMMGTNEERTVQILRGHREIFDALLHTHRGRIFNTAGDAILAEFPSAVEAVRCATEIQSAVRTRNEHFPEEQRMWFRIGINLGDVIIQGEDLLGDGVNVAARIQTVAEPGGVCISGSVYDQIQNKLTLQFKALGECTFKNIAQPVRTFSISESDSGAMPSVQPVRQKRSWRPAVIALAGLLILAAGFVYLYDQGQEGRQAEEELRMANEARLVAETELQQAKLEAEVNVAKAALERAEQERNRLDQELMRAEEEKRAAEAQRQTVEAEIAKMSQEQAAAEETKAPVQEARTSKETVQQGPSPAPAVRTDKSTVFDGSYEGELCNKKRGDRKCWPVRLAVEQSIISATWTTRGGKSASAKGTVASDGAVDMTLQSWRYGQPIEASLTGWIEKNKIKVSGRWRAGPKVTGKWTRDR